MHHIVKTPCAVIVCLLGLAGAARADSTSGVSMQSGSTGSSHHHRAGAPRAAGHSHQGKHYAVRGGSSRRRGGGGGVQWGAIAVALTDDGVASGFASHKSSPSEATSAAIAACSGTGRSGCYTPIAAFTGCAYVSISVEGSDHSAWGTGSTPQAAIEQCQSNGVSCTYPQGGCN